MTEGRDLPVFRTKFVQVLNKLLCFIIILLSCMIVLIVSYFVFSRYILKKDFPAFEELCTILVFWLYFLGSSYCGYERSYIKADIVNLIRNEKVKRVIRVIASAVGICILVIVLYLAIKFMMWNWEKGQKSFVLQIPMIVSHSAIVTGYILMLFYDTCHFVGDIEDLIRGNRTNGSGQIQEIPIEPMN